MYIHIYNLIRLCLGVPTYILYSIWFFRSSAFSHFTFLSFFYCFRHLFFTYLFLFCSLNNILIVCLFAYWYRCEFAVCDCICLPFLIHLNNKHNKNKNNSHNDKINYNTACDTRRDVFLIFINSILMRLYLYTFYSSVNVDELTTVSYMNCVKNVILSVFRFY